MNRLFRPVALLLIVLLGSAAYSTIPSFLTCEKLHVSQESLDFGVVDESHAFDWELPIRNNSNQPVRIRGFERSCQCTQIEPRELIIGGRSTATVRLTIDLTNRVRTSDSGLSLREFSLLFRPIIDEEPLKVGEGSSWRLTGRVSPLISCATDEVRFESYVSGNPYPPQTITIQARGDVLSLAAKASRSDFSVAVHRNAEDQSVFSVVVAPNPSLGCGKINATLYLTPLLENDILGPRLSIPVSGSIVHDIELSPVQTYFGEVKVGLPVSANISIVSRSNRQFAILQDDESGIRIVPKTKDAGPRQVIAVELTPQLTGANAITREIHIIYGDTSLQTSVRLNCGYFGVH